MDEGFGEDREERLPSKPAFYVRSNAPFTMASALLLLGSLISLLSFVWVVTNGIQENVRTEIRNETSQRINQDNKIEGRLDTCCSRKRW